MKRLLPVALLLCGLAAARANQVFTISLTGLQETPPNGSLATGSGVALYDSIAGTISLSVSFVGLSTSATASHIHDGPVGIPGPVIVSFVSFTPNATSGSIIGGPLAFPLAEVADLLAGDTYFNIHDAEFPGGEIRGQLVPVPGVPDAGSTLALLGFGLLALGWTAKRSAIAT